MKLTIAFVGLLFATATAQVQASEEKTSRTRESGIDATLNRSFNTCARTFLARIFPGQNVQDLPLHIKLRRIEQSYSKLKRIEQSYASVWGNETFKLQAWVKGEGFPLSEASCTVNSRDAQLVSLKFSFDPSPAKLAGLTPKDIRLAVAD